MSEMHMVPPEGEPIQGELFTVEMTKPSEGAVRLAHALNVALPHTQTAELLKRRDFGEGSIVSFKGGTGTIGTFSKFQGKAVWTVSVEDLELEL